MVSPASFSSRIGLAGSHSAPPDRAVDPPTYADLRDQHLQTTLRARRRRGHACARTDHQQVHGALPTQFKNVFEGHVATQYMNGESRPDIGDPGDSKLLGTTSVASHFGSSFMLDDLTYHYEDVDHKTILINFHHPIDANSFVLLYGIIVKKSEALPGHLALETAVGLGDFVKMGFEQDVEIWKNKARIDNPLLCEEDGPVYQLRRWYQQFYVDVADVQPDMVDRFEHELDTTSPHEEWMKVVETNLAAGTT